MLKQMRGFSRSWVARIFLLLLGVSMSIVITQGRVDIMRILGSFTGPHGVADVAGRDISPREVSRALDNVLNQQRAQGRTITQAEAIEQGVHRRILESLIEQHAVRAYAEKLGIHASLQQIAESIRQMPATHGGISGTFDRATYVQLLQRFQYSEPEFEDEQRGFIETDMFGRAVTDGVRAPSSFGKLALAFSSEQRVVSVAEAPMALAGNVPNPDAQQLQAFYEDSREQLRVPAFRAVTLVYARQEDFIARVNVPEAQLRQEFENRRAALNQPEKRTFVRIAAQTEQQARDAATRMARGEAPDAVARALSLQMVRSQDETRDHVADPLVAQAVFAMASGAPPRAVPAQLTPFVAIKLESITPAVTAVYEHERDAIREAIARDQASDLLNTAEQGFEEARAGGATVVDAARQHGLAVVVVPAVEEHGLTPQGQPAEAFVDQPELLRTAFATNEGEASDFTPAGDADVIVAVDRITPATVRPLAEVRAQLTQAWLNRERARRLQDIANTVSEEVAHGTSFAASIRAHHLVVRVTSQPIDRQNAQRLPAQQLGPAIFSAHPGDVVNAMMNDGSGLIVATVESIRHADPAQAREFVEQARQQAQQGLAASLFEAATAEAVRVGNARRNTQLLNETFRTTTPGEEPAQQ